MNSVEELKEMFIIKDDEDVEAKFKQIANALFQNYHIEKGTDRYDFLEIEFYYFNEQHPDIITYPRTIDGGKWFLHASGIDIAFQSKAETDEKGKIDYDNSFFGGILIRSLSKRTANDSSRVIGGPRRCLYELFNGIDIFNPQSECFPKLVYNQKVDVNPELPVLRQISNIDTKKSTFPMDDQEDECLKKNYCYFVIRNDCNSSWYDELEKKYYTGVLPWNRKRI
ncbi:hypothetical protein [uncultured Bacteroides sp.]|uniref:hypothetical protein n=1 Tax=uncultured Bacteroides sp. TaxID=162156 RepID=UPI002AABAA99|nr:hypothetical protein [uncultured Bacteroides sp.]